MTLWQPPLPPRYNQMSDAHLAQAITAGKKQLGSDLVILGHHYQQNDVVKFADFAGDSFKLSQLAADVVQKTAARYVIFAGVHFMAESADILTPDHVAVILPDLGAGCSMADMADIDQTIEAWEIITQALDGTHTRLIPICYMNCTAAIKAFCGRRGGAVCTSSNAQAVIEWALAGGATPLDDDQQVKLLFLPDQHLGRNTAAAMGYDVNQDMAVWDPQDPLDEQDIRSATFLLWKGHCSVHMLFRPEHVDQIRTQWPDVTVMVHPECRHEVVEKSDRTGSTEAIVQAVRAADPGSRWALGTEVHLVNRLTQEAAQRDVQVRMLSECQCLCTTMYRIDMPHLAWVIDNLLEGKVVNRITVPPEVRRWSTVALERMLSITSSNSKLHAQTQT